MRMKKLLFLASLAILVTTLSVPAFGYTRGLGSAVAKVSAADNTALGGLLGVRVYSDCDAAINKNETATQCNGGPGLNIRCLRPYVSTATLEPGGYEINSFTNPYTACLNGVGTFWTIWDGEVGAGTPGHQAYYGASGIIGTSTNTGDKRTTGCTGTVTQNCFGRLDDESRVLPIDNALHGFGGVDPNTVRSIGGLSPVPIPKVARTAGDNFQVTWDDPENYLAAMRNSAASNVTGIRLFRLDDANGNDACDEPTGTSAGWTAVGDFAMGSGSTGTGVTLTDVAGLDCVFYAAAVTFRGPDAAPAGPLLSGGTVINNVGFVGGHSQPVSRSPLNVKIIKVKAQYQGRGNVGISWEAGLEGGIQGYYVQRGSSAEGPFTRVSEMIAPRGDSSSYTYADKVTASAGPFYYRVEAVKADGTSIFAGPTAVIIQQRTKTGIKGVAR